MGELARQPGCPELPATPLELLTPQPGFQAGYSTFEKWFWPVGGVISGLLSSITRNALVLRPIWSGIQLHIIFAVCGGFGATKLRDWKFAEQTESEEVIKHYITLHPEDFPPYERKRFRDVYQPFHPFR